MNHLELNFTIIVLAGLLMINIVSFWDIKKGLRGYAITLSLCFAAFLIYNDFSVTKTIKPVELLASYLYDIGENVESSSEDAIFDGVNDEAVLREVSYFYGIEDSKKASNVITFCDYESHRVKVKLNLKDLSHILRNISIVDQGECSYKFYVMYFDTRRSVNVEAYITTDGSTGPINVVSTSILNISY